MMTALSQRYQTFYIITDEEAKKARAFVPGKVFPAWSNI
jgi:hypothetical protein